MTRDRSTVEAALLKKGFRKDDSHHHFYIYWNLDGKKTAKKTKTSHGSSYKTLGDPLLKAMARQVGLTKPKFLELVDCSMDQKAYEKELGFS
ncbi:MAG: hypothetical protein FP826_01605 [Sphingomonadales bacterium]|nr:hypothetical protein [Sphingomonadales bacterium]